jgi:hypothetical protein
MRQDKDTQDAGLKARRYEALEGVEVDIPSADGTTEQVAEKV